MQQIAKPNAPLVCATLVRFEHSLLQHAIALLVAGNRAILRTSGLLLSFRVTQWSERELINGLEPAHRASVSLADEAVDV